MRILIVSSIAALLAACAGGSSTADPDWTAAAANSVAGGDSVEPQDGTTAGPPRDADVAATAPTSDRDGTSSDPSPSDSLGLGWRTECAWAGAAPGTEHVDDVIQLELTVGDDFDVLYGMPPPDPDTSIVADFELGFDGDQASGQTEVELRGHSSRGLPKRPFNLRLDRLVPPLDTDRLSVNAMFGDPSLMRERLSLWVFDQLGLITPRTDYVDLTINDSYEGMYVSVQRVDDQLLADHDVDPQGATMVRDRSRQIEGGLGSFLEPSGPDSPATRDDVRAHVEAVLDSRGDPDWDRVAELAEWSRARLGELGSGEMPDGDLAEELEQYVDLDDLADFAVAQTLVGDVDWVRDDYWLVRSAGDDARFRFVPWDKDMSFGSHWAAGRGDSTNHFFYLDWGLHGRIVQDNAITRVALANVGWRAEFHARLEAALNGTFSLTSLCERLGALAAAVEPRADRRRGDGGFRWNPSQHFAEPGDTDLHLATILDYAQRRAALLRAQMATASGEVIGSSLTNDEMSATVEIDAADVGSSVLFTDDSGWTIARLDLTEVSRPGRVTISVVPDDVSSDVDRRWTVDAEGTEAGGRLNLYFRNNPAHGDWYRPADDGGADPVGRQADLAIAVLGEDGSIAEVLEAEANPYSDRVVSRFEVTGSKDLVLVLPAG